MIEASRWALVLGVCVSSAACSSADFDVAGEPGSDAAITDTGVSSEVGQPGDTGSAGDSGADTGVTVLDGGSVCTRLDDPTDVWVDASSTVPSPSGAADCPFRHIGEAVAYVATLSPKARTIHLRAGTYVEGTAIRVAPQITLQGAGAASTKISGGGPCGTASSDPSCIIRLETGGTVDSLGVDGGSSKHGIVTYATGGAAAPRIMNTQVFNSNGDGLAGVLVTGGALLGPAFESFNNRFGVLVWGNLGMAFTGSGNRVENNSGVGIEHQGTGPLAINNVSIGSNLGGGLRAGHITTTTLSTPPTHYVTNATIRGNGNFGIMIGTNAGMRLRTCTITGNPFGVIANYGAGNSFDFGVDGGDQGNNTFGGPSAKNARAGVCVLATRNTPLPAVGNRWTKCDPDVRTLNISSGCDAADTYADVWYRGVSAPNTNNCSVGP